MPSDSLTASHRAALCADSEEDFLGAFERVAQSGVVVDASLEDELGWIQRYHGAGRGVADVLPDWDHHIRLWLSTAGRIRPQRLQELSTRCGPELAELFAFCMALVGHGTWPERVLERLLIPFLNAAPGTFAFEQQLPTAQLARVAERQLRERPWPLMQWTRIEALLPHAEPELRVELALNYCGQDFRLRAHQLLSQDPIAARRTLSERMCQGEHSAEGQIVAALHWAATRARGELELPSWVRLGLILDLCSGSLADVSLSLDALRRLPADLSRPLISEHLKESRASALIGAVADDDLIAELIARAGSGQVEPELAVAALKACGRRSRRILTERSERAWPAACVKVATEVLVGQLSLSEARAVIVWLGHSSRTAAKAAQRLLLSCEAPPTEALREASKGDDPRVAAACRAILQKLDRRRKGAKTPLERVETAARTVAAERETFVALCERLKDSPPRWSSQLLPIAHRYGAVALHWLRPWFETQATSGEARLWCALVEALSDDPHAVWVAVDSFARLPKLPTVLWTRPRHALAAAGELLGPPITYVLGHLSTEYAEPLTRLLAKHANDAARDVLLEGLASDSKSIRTHCVDGLSRLRSVECGPLLPLLRHSSQGTRMAVSELLAIWGQKAARDALVAAYASERSQIVKAYLQDALTSVGALEEVLGAKRVTKAAVRRFVEAHPRPRKLPPFLGLAERSPPQLLWRDGSPLEEEAAQGFLALVMTLDVTHKGRTLRALLPALDARSLSRWSRYIHESWARAKDSRQKWAALQLWLLADTATIGRVGWQLGLLHAGEHSAGSLYLRVLQWRGTEQATDWLAHWSECLHSRGLRDQAKELLSRVAYKRQLSPSQLRDQVNPLLWHREMARQLAASPATPRNSERAIRHLREAWLYGGSWSAERLGELLRAFPKVMSGLWVRRGQEVRPVGSPVVRRSGRGRWALYHPLDECPLPRGAFPDGRGPSLQQAQRRIFIPGGEEDLRLDTLDTDTERFERWRRAEQWFHGEPLEHGLVSNNTLPVPAYGLVAMIHHTGYSIGDKDWVEPLQVLALSLHNLEGGEVDFEAVPPLVYSEVCYSLHCLSTIEEQQ